MNTHHDPHSDGFLPADPDAQVGIIFSRLSTLSRELGPPAVRVAVQAALQAIGVAAHAEAERRASLLADRGRPHPSDPTVTPFRQRKAPEPLDEGDA
ncbi:hypothetical protein [Methylobacterium sp. Leaf100]|uniref:hypothetical protein n=1 Tax=Methylobacterium sp. Leaf100 TaxID=1736252 RepID=UPI0006F779C1|nr:hypothetical protein [Methylobacterium sp. Leaf100]KQP21474.1 hypothetical protein ASF25_21580 [Methylobacterium sp. Leaf100]